MDCPGLSPAHHLEWICLTDARAFSPFGGPLLKMRYPYSQLWRRGFVLSPGDLVLWLGTLTGADSLALSLPAAGSLSLIESSGNAIVQGEYPAPRVGDPQALMPDGAPLVMPWPGMITPGHKRSMASSCLAA